MKSFLVLFLLSFFTMSFDSYGAQLCTKAEIVLNKIESKGWGKNLQPFRKLTGRSYCEITSQSPAQVETAVSLDGCFDYHVASIKYSSQGPIEYKKIEISLSSPPDYDHSKIICYFPLPKAISKNLGDALKLLDDKFRY